MYNGDDDPEGGAPPSQRGGESGGEVVGGGQAAMWGSGTSQWGGGLGTAGDLFCCDTPRRPDGGRAGGPPGSLPGHPLLAGEGSENGGEPWVCVGSEGRVGGESGAWSGRVGFGPTPPERVSHSSAKGRHRERRPGLLARLPLPPALETQISTCVGQGLGSMPRVGAPFSSVRPIFRPPHSLNRPGVSPLPNWAVALPLPRPVYLARLYHKSAAAVVVLAGRPSDGWRGGQCAPTPDSLGRFGKRVVVAFVTIPDARHVTFSISPLSSEGPLPTDRFVVARSALSTTYSW